MLFAEMLIGGGDGSYKLASAKAEAINELFHTITVTEVRSLLGLLNSFKNFIPNFTQLLPSIRNLLKKRYGISLVQSVRVIIISYEM